MQETWVATPGVERWPPASLMAALSPADQAAFLTLGVRRTYLPGEALMRQGEPGDFVVLLLGGCARIAGTTNDGRSVLLAIRLRGDLVGEFAVLDHKPRSATVTAVGRTPVRVVGGREFSDFILRHPVGGAVVHRYILAKLRMATRYQIEVGGGPVVVRLARALSLFGGDHADGAAGGPVRLPLRQADVAELLGVGLSSVERALAELRQRGAVTTGRNRLTILDMDRLASVAGELDVG